MLCKLLGVIMGDNRSKDQFPGQLETERFLHLLTANHHRIYAFIMTLVPNSNDADDIMQETTTVMLKKFGEFELGTDFVAWGIAVAHYVILSFKNNLIIGFTKPIMFNFCPALFILIRHTTCL